METPKLSRVIRLDSLPLLQTHYTPEGYLLDRPVLTSTGIFEYRNADGSVRRELRLPEDVFDPSSLASYKGKPIIITHDVGLVNKDNVLENQIGTILTEGYRDGNDVRAEITIHGTDEMKECGLKELSLGYELDLDETPGTWNGMKYDAIQRNIRVNHLALVRNARAGDQARLNIDSRDSITILKGGKAMSKTQKNACRADGTLTTEELQKAIEEYMAHRAQSAKANADDTVSEEKTAEVPAVETAAAVENPVVSTEPETGAKAEDGDDTTAAKTGESTVEEEVNGIRESANKEDGEEDAVALKEQIKHLCDIIDGLLAERDFQKANAGDGKDAECDGEEEGAKPAEETAAPATATKTDDDTDQTAAGATAGPEKTEPKSGSTMNADSVDEIIRERIQVGMVGRTLNLDGLEALPLKDAKKAIILAVRPNLRLDGRNDAYIEAAYSLAVDDAKKASRKDTSYQKKQMFNKDTRVDSNDDGNSAKTARQKMIERMMKEDK